MRAVTSTGVGTLRVTEEGLACNCSTAGVAEATDATRRSAETGRHPGVFIRFATGMLLVANACGMPSNER
jgi:hypothetical protein